MSTVFLVTYFSVHFITDNFLTKFYSAMAVIEVRRSTSAGDGVTPVELETIRSPDVLLPVIKALGLETEWARQMAQTDALTDSESISRINRMLHLKSPRGSDSVNICVIGKIPRETADIANAIAERYRVLRNSESQRETSGLGSHHSRYIGASNLMASTLPLLTTDTPKVSIALRRENPVRIVALANVPVTPSKPSQNFRTYFPLLTASLMGLIAASFVEVMYLFVRAAEISAPLPDSKPCSSKA